MLKYVVAFVLFSPLVGLLMMENGAYGVSLGRYGYQNGASLAYLGYAATFLLTCFLATRSIPRSAGVPDRLRSEFTAPAVVVLVLNLAFVLVIYAGFGAYQVVLGHMDKGQFRVTLGSGGALAYMTTKYFAPAMLGYLSFLFVVKGRPRRYRVLLLANLLVGFVLGMGWGFKATSLWILLPSLMILFWRLSLRDTLGFCLIVPTILVGTFWFFDRTGEDILQVLDRLWVRATVVQGDVSWFVWEMLRNGETFPDYWITLLPVTGDTIFSTLTGITKENYAEWVAHHYDLLLTRITGYPLESIAAGTTFTATPFSEGIIAFGSPGIALGGVAAALVLSCNYRLVCRAVRRGDPILYSLTSTYFAFVTLPWLAAGGVIQLVHLAVWIGMVATWLILTGLSSLAALAREGHLRDPSRVRLLAHISD